MLYGITDLATFVIGTVVIVLLPGPNSLYVMTVASRFGVAMGYRSACGIFVGDTVLMILSATGAASLLQSTPALFAIIKYAGAGYLAWLGVVLVRGAWAAWRRGPVSPAQPTPVDAAQPFRTALVISLMNPKAILFFVSFFIQFVSPSYPYPALSFLILGLIVQFFSLVYLTLLIYGGARLALWFRRSRRFAAVATGSVGGLFIGFGVKLANATLG
jgi:leucine efflux protein